MKIPTSEIDRLVSSVSRQIYDSNIVRLLCVTTESIEITRHFLDALIRQQSEGLASKVDVVYQVHNILEVMAEVAEMPACTCMAHLWIYANQLFMHDVCDSIDLWLANCKSDILQDRLLIIATIQNDEGIMRHFEQLARSPS